jgi:DNA-binding NarL/FixJ family response regulator
MNESKYVTEETIDRTLVVGRPSGNRGKQESNRQQVRAGAMSSPMKPIRVLLAEDHMLVREGLRKMLDLETNIEVIAEAKNGRQAVSLAIQHCPDVVLMDIAMPGLNGLEATRQVLKALPNTKVIILTAHNDDAYVNSATASGAVGFLLKQTSAHNVCQAIRDVHAGKTFFSPSITRRQARLRQQSPLRSNMTNKKTALLTSREVEVLQLIAEGKANKEIASDLCISIKTVEKHRGHLMEKLDIHDTASLSRYAISAGIIESSVQVTII